jgi:hypothetical protein
MKNSSEKITKENKKNRYLHEFLFFIPRARKFITSDLTFRGIDLFAVKRDGGTKMTNLLQINHVKSLLSNIFEGKN